MFPVKQRKRNEHSSLPIQIPLSSAERGNSGRGKEEIRNERGVRVVQRERE